jgi:hypothetical protein
LLGSATGIFGMEAKKDQAIDQVFNNLFGQLCDVETWIRYCPDYKLKRFQDAELLILSKIIELGQYQNLPSLIKKGKKMRKEYELEVKKYNERFNNSNFGNFAFSLGDSDLKDEKSRLELKKEQLDIIENKIKAFIELDCNEIQNNKRKSQITEARTSLEENKGDVAEDQKLLKKVEDRSKRAQELVGNFMNQFFVAGDTSLLDDYDNANCYNDYEKIVRTWEKKDYYTFLGNKIKLRNLYRERFQSHEFLKDDPENQEKQENRIKAETLEITNVQNKLISQVNKQSRMQKIEKKIRNATYNDPTRV